MTQQYKTRCLYKITLPTLIAISSLIMSCRPRDNGASAISDLDGTWTSTCRSRTDQLGTAYFEKNTLVFSGFKMTSSVRSYSDAGCQKELNDKPLLSSVSAFTIGDFVPGAGGAKKFNRQTQNLSITLTTDAWVTLYNGTTKSPPVCGGGFVKNQPKELTAARCATTDSLRTEFEMEYDIYKVADKILYFGFMGTKGSNSDGRADSSRPTALDPAYFTKL